MAYKLLENLTWQLLCTVYMYVSKHINTLYLHADLHRDISSTLPTGVGVRGYEDADDITPLDRPRTQTRQRRSQTMNFIPQMGPEYKFIEKYNIVSVSGKIAQSHLSPPNLSLSLSLSAEY